MRRALWLELAAFTLIAAAAAACIPLAAGSFGWNWDALNHHIYLGWMAESPRLQLDVIAANYQSYQYPYLYWPVYRLSLLSGQGAHFGALWSALQAALLLPPVWFISLRLLAPAAGALQGAFERAVACALAFASVIVLAGLEVTSNDLLAAVPLLWALACGLAQRCTDRQAFVCALLWGVSVAFKLSNLLFAPLLLLWWWVPVRPHLGMRRGLALACGAIVGSLVAYAPWGWQLWRLSGNPFYPMLRNLFGP